MVTKLKMGFRNEMTNGHKIENCVQNEMTNGHKIEKWVQSEMIKLEQQNLAQKLEPEQDDGLSQKREQKLGHKLV